MEGVDFNIILEQILNQIMSVFTAGTLNIMVVLGITVLTQVIKLSWKWISKKILLIPVILSAGMVCFSIFVLKSDVGLIPIIFFGYLGGSIAMYFILKKFLPDFFKSNYNFINGDQSENKSSNKKDSK